jgi:hypothetical protein
MTTATALRSRHLLGIEDLEPGEIDLILDTALAMKEVGARPIKKVPTLRGRTVVNLFFEASTRTRMSFELAEKRLSADTLGMTVSGSSVAKGETLTDTARTIEAMAPDMIVIRHASSGAPHHLSRVCRASVINAGDGTHEHPTQALLDAFTIRERKGRIAGLRGGHRRRSRAQPRAAVEYLAADETGRVGCRVRPADARAAGTRSPRRHRDALDRRGRQRRGRHHDVARAARAHARADFCRRCASISRTSV